VLNTCHFSRSVTRYELCETDSVEKFMYLLAQILPQMMSQAGFSVIAVALTITVSDVYRFVYCIDDLRDKNAVAAASKPITATGTANAGH
jgi:hypothetical protein